MNMRTDRYIYIYILYIYIYIYIYIYVCVCVCVCLCVYVFVCVCFSLQTNIVNESKSRGKLVSNLTFKKCSSQLQLVLFF